MLSGISRLSRQIHPRDIPDMRTCTQSRLKSSISNSSCMLARNKGFAFRLGDATTAVPDFFTATIFWDVSGFVERLRGSRPRPASCQDRDTDGFFSAALDPANSCAASPRLTGEENGMPVSCRFGIGAEIVGSAVLRPSALGMVATFDTLASTIPGMLINCSAS